MQFEFGECDGAIHCIYKNVNSCVTITAVVVRSHFLNCVFVGVLMLTRSRKCYPTYNCTELAKMLASLHLSR